MSQEDWIKRLEQQDYVSALRHKPGPGLHVLDMELDLRCGETATLWLRTADPESALLMFTRYVFEDVPARDLLPLLKALNEGEFEEHKVGKRWRISIPHPKYVAYSRVTKD